MSSASLDFPLLENQMAIVGVTTGLDISIEATTLKTGLTWYMNNGVANGESSVLAPSNATSFLGKSLNATGDRAAVRSIKVAANAG